MEEVNERENGTYKHKYFVRLSFLFDLFCFSLCLFISFLTQALSRTEGSNSFHGFLMDASKIQWKVATMDDH